MQTTPFVNHAKPRRIELPDEVVIEDAEEAIRHALAVRKLHAKRSRPGSPQRETDIRIALMKLKAAMHPIRKKAAMFVYHRTHLSSEIKDVSKLLQRERRKLWKMQRKSKRKRRN